MIRLLQKLDETGPRQPAGSLTAPLPRRVTLLAGAGQGEAGALEDFAHGQEWVRWLLAGVRRKGQPIHCGRAGAPKMAAVRTAWADFASTRLPAVLRPHFLKAWRAAAAGDLAAVLGADAAFTQALGPEEAARSIQAGTLLLRATHRARYQGWLGRYRQACEDGPAPGHFLTVWAGVADFFQLGLAAAAAEYLRLEWEILSWNLPAPPALEDLPILAGRMLEAAGADLRLVE